LKNCFNKAEAEPDSVPLDLNGLPLSAKLKRMIDDISKRTGVTLRLTRHVPMASRIAW
jgi:hypothetical protein